MAPPAVVKAPRGPSENPVEPIAAPAAAPTPEEAAAAPRTSSESIAEESICDIELTITEGAIVGFAANAFIAPHIPPPFSSYIFW